ncbi:hypothetical protein BASA81_008120 [Batrachochytrium salamandrivorans]|nr:hypothetical protein BASA81_008120 [Batrachochytrium salamandrivorans]
MPQPRFLLVSTIGVGSFGIVARADLEHNSQTCALKTITKANRSLQEISLLKREISICKRLTNSRGIVLTVHSYETLNELVVVQERALGDLFRVLKDDGKLSEPRVKDIALQLSLALDYLHNEMRITHRDLKPQNILLFRNGRVALCDFGFARALGTGSSLHTTIKGTPLYMAPELVQERPYSFRVDLWSLGVILYELVEGVPPFFAASLVELMKQIVSSKLQLPATAAMSPHFQSFLLGLLQKDPAQRLCWPKLLSDPFLTLQTDISAVDATEQAEEREGRRRLLEIFPSLVNGELEAARLDGEDDAFAASPSALMKKFLARIYQEYGILATSINEDAINKHLATDAARIEFVACLIDRLESGHVLPMTTTLFLLRVVRKLIKAHGLQLPSRDIQRLALVLLKQENIKLVSQALKLLDTFLFLKQHAQVLDAIVISEHESVICLMLDLFLRPSFQLLSDAGHLLSVLLVNLGHPLGKQVNYYMSKPTLNVLFQILQSTEPSYATLQRNVLNILLLSCSFVNGVLVQRLQLEDWAALLERLAFESKSSAAVGLLESIVRFCRPGYDAWAVRACEELLEDGVEFGFAHALARLVLLQTGASSAPPEIPVFYLTAFPDEQSEAFFSLLLVAQPRPTITKLVWEACWKQTRNPNEALQALKCRHACLGEEFIPSRKSVLEKIQHLVRRELSPQFLTMVFTSPKTHGGGGFGCKRIYLEAVWLLEQMLRLEISSLQQSSHFPLMLECTFRIFSNLGYMVGSENGGGRGDKEAIGRIAALLLFMLDTASTSSNRRKLAKQMVECKHAVDNFAKIWHSDLETGLLLYSHWMACGSILPGMERFLQEVPITTNPQEISPQAVNSLLQIISAICRKFNLWHKNVKDVLKGLFTFLGEVDTEGMDRDCLALAIGNAAFHSDVFYPVLERFVPLLLESMQSNHHRARTNSALALGNLLRNGPHCDLVIAHTPAIELLLEGFDLDEDGELDNLVEQHVVLIALGNFASQDQCRARLMGNPKLKLVLDFAHRHVNTEIKNAGQRLATRVTGSC